MTDKENEENKDDKENKERKQNESGKSDMYVVILFISDHLSDIGGLSSILP